jgi:hypothetical protein
MELVYEMFWNTHDGKKKEVAKLWKNGVATSLSDATQNAQSRSVFVK